MMSESEHHQLPQLRLSDGPNFDNFFQIPENNHFQQTTILEDLTIPNSLHPTHQQETHLGPSLGGYLNVPYLGKKKEY